MNEPIVKARILKFVADVVAVVFSAALVARRNIYYYYDDDDQESEKFKSQMFHTPRKGSKWLVRFQKRSPPQSHDWKIFGGSTRYKHSLPYSPFYGNGNNYNTTPQQRGFKCLPSIADIKNTYQ